jgi:hypothetical protein
MGAESRSVVARARYRSRQFFDSLRPRVDAGLQAESFDLLSPAQRELFLTMTPRDREHCLAVYDRLRREGRDERDLLVAGLLHDAGKGRVALWHRVAYVLLSAGAPGLLRRLVEPGDGASWRQALYRCLHHPRLGAERAREAGCSAGTVALICDDATGAPAEQLLALHTADDAV